jgi:transposase-like protein
MPVLSYVHHLFNVDQCQASIHTLRWKDRPLQCPRCQSQDVDPWVKYHYRPGCKRSWCNGCKRTFNDLTATLLRQSKRSLPHWILATFLLCLSCSSGRRTRDHHVSDGREADQGGDGQGRSAAPAATTFRKVVCGYRLPTIDLLGYIRNVLIAGRASRRARWRRSIMNTTSRHAGCRTRTSMRSGFAISRRPAPGWPRCTRAARVPKHKAPKAHQHGQAPMHHPPLVLPPGAATGIGSLPFRDPHTAVQCVAQTCPRLPFWPELPPRAPDARSVAQTFSACADLVHPCRTGSGYEVVPGRRAVLVERLEQGPTCLVPARTAGFFAFEPAMAAGRFGPPGACC